MSDFLEQFKKRVQAKEESGENPYAHMRDSVDDDDVRIDWRDGDRWRSYATEAYEAARGDETLSAEGRANKERQAYDTAWQKAEKGYEAARARARKLAKEKALRAVPMPDGKSLYTAPLKDAQSITAAQGEAERIAQSVAGASLQQLTREASKNPRDKGIQDAPDASLSKLQAEFANAMDIGGVEGDLRAHGTIRVAQAMGIPVEDVTSAHMEDIHRNAYDATGRYEDYVRSIPKADHIPHPTPPPRQGHVPGNYDKGQAFLTPGKGTLKVGAKRRGRSW